MDTAISALKNPSLAYNQNATIQIQIANELVHKIEKVWPQWQPKTIADLGCGTGTLTHLISTHFSPTYLVGIDQNPEYTKFAKTHLNSTHFETQNIETWVTNTPLDALVSSSALHWINTPKTTFPALLKNLKPNGDFAAAIFGPNTYQELQSTLNEHLKTPSLLPATLFPSPQTWHSLITPHFKTNTLKQTEIRVVYPTLKALLLAIKNTQTVGLGLPRKQQWTPRILETLDRLYRQKYGQIWATHHIIWALASGYHG